MADVLSKKSVAFLLIIGLIFFFRSLPQARAFSNPATVPLSTISNFAALAHSTITSPTGPTVLNDGDLGVDLAPGACTGFPSPCTASGPGTINNGTIQQANAVTSQGQTDATAAVANIALRSPDQTLAAQLGSQTLTQGIYQVPADTTNLTGDLTLSGDADSVFIFHLTSTLITDNGSRVLLTGGVQACHVFWKVDSSATFNGNTTFAGTVLAAASITFSGPGATLAGRAVAQTAAITFNNTTINNSSCAVPTPTPTPTPTLAPTLAPTSTPTPTPKPDAPSSDTSSNSSSSSASESSPSPTPTSVPAVRLKTTKPNSVIAPGFPNTGFAPYE